MGDARTDILQRVRSAVAACQPMASARAAVRPAWTEDAGARLCDRLTAASATVVSVRDRAGAVAAIDEFLRGHGLPDRVLAAPHPSLTSLPWRPNLHVESRPIVDTDVTAVTMAFAAVAETGSLVLASSAQTPTQLNFLPDNFVCLLPENRIVHHLEDVWALLRAELGTLPRAVNFVTGPSRTADVEQTLQLGAHGPRRVHVVLCQGFPL